MRARQLSEEIRETQLILGRLQESLMETQRQVDPFGVFIYQQRKEYRLRSDSDKSKSGKRTREWVQASYVRAMKKGFRGDSGAWIHLLTAYTPEIAPDEPV